MERPNKTPSSSFLALNTICSKVADFSSLSTQSLTFFSLYLLLSFFLSLCAMDTAQWPQGIGVIVRPVENSIRTAEKKPRPQREQALNCPRCNSTNTKFCYYNNYSLSQPRYFCKACRRYWTEGGTLRNVPVGGGSRKKQKSSSSSSSSSKKSLVPDLSPPKFLAQNPKIQDGQDLNLAYNSTPAIYNGIPELVALPFALDSQNPNFPSSNSSHLPFMELLTSSVGLNSLVSPPLSNSNSVFSSSFNPSNEFKPSSSFSLDHGIENGFGNLQAAVRDHTTTSSSSRIVFPFEEMKPDSNGGSNGYWNGGSW